jgi:predicted transcriptional regulator
MVKTHRGRGTVIYDILSCCNSKVLNSAQICLHANLNPGYFHSFVDGLVSCGFLSVVRVGDRVGYRLSSKGLVFVRKYEELQVMAGPLVCVFGVAVF